MESEFVDLVHRMRKAQKEYFKSRDKDVLKKSIELEEKVDEYIQKHYNYLKEIYND